MKRNEFYYVIQTNEITGMSYLLGYNLTEEQKNEKFYSLGPDAKFDDEHLRNYYGGHTKFYNSDESAYKELMLKPDEFNNALALLNKYGYSVVKKSIVNKQIKVVSYQQEFEL
jgi:hypothetical protein